MRARPPKKAKMNPKSDSVSFTPLLVTTLCQNQIARALSNDNGFEDVEAFC